MSRRYSNFKLFAAVCSSYVVLCAISFSANAADELAPNAQPKQSAPKSVSANKPAKNTQVSLEDSDSWRGKSVFNRTREEYKSEGVRLGGFKFKPTLGLNETFDSNIYATQGSKKSDMITKVTPGVALESDWSNNSLNFTASGDIGTYANNSRENYGDYTVGSSGRLDILKQTFVSGAVSQAKLHEDRGSADSRVSNNPTEYIQNDAGLGFVRQLRKISMKLNADFRNYNYLNGENSSNRVVVNNDRDRDEYKTTARFGYEIIPEYEAFVRGSLNKRDYSLPLDNSGVNRDSKGYDAVVGTALNLGGKTKGEVFVGYMSQNYSAATLEDVGAPQYGADILWNISGLTSLKAGILRGVSETTVTGYSSSNLTAYSIGLEHEISYNLLAGIDTSYSISEYNSSTAASRKDYVTGAGAELRYLVNRNASVVGRYDYSTRDTNAAGRDYNRSQVSLGLKLAM